MNELDLNLNTTEVAVVNKIKHKDNNASSSNAVAEALFNKVDKKFIFDGSNEYDWQADVTGYINTTTGDVVPNGTSYVSQEIPVEELTDYYIYNRTGNGGAAFIDSGGTRLKPLKLDGTPYSTFSVPLNGGIKSPTGAVEFQMTTQFVGTGNRENTMFTDSANAIKIKTSLIPEISTGIKNLVFQSGLLYFASEYDSTKKLVREIDLEVFQSFSSSPLLDFKKEYLAENESLTTVETLIKESGDDTTPFNLNGSYIGAGHGWNQAKLLTKVGHGKTIADVGSIYNDGSYNFTILRVVDADNLWICSENQSIDGFSYDFQPPTGTLTYVSDGDNTGSISSYTTSFLGNLNPVAKTTSLKLYADGKSVDLTDKSLSCEELIIMETYVVYDLPSILTEITAQRPGGGYLTDVYFNELGADVLFTAQNTYKLQTNGTMLIYRNFIANKKLNFNFDGIIQFEALASGDLYIPKTNSLVAGGTTYDFTKIEDWSVAPAASIYMDSNDWSNPSSPPARFVNLNSDINVHGGYLVDRGYGINRAANIGDAFYLNTSNKIYPFYKNDSANEVIDVNEFYSGVAFRQFVNPTDFPTGRTHFSWFNENGVILIHLDYHGTLLDTIEAHPSWVGRTVEVVEKSANISVMTDVVPDSLQINSTATSSVYGFAVLKLKS